MPPEPPRLAGSHAGKRLGLTHWQPESTTADQYAEEQARDFTPGSTWVSGTAYDAYEPGDEL